MSILKIIFKPIQVLASSLASKEEWNLSKDEWKSRLTPESYYILREEGTERAFSSQLNNEKRKGIFHCAGCDLPLFSSDKKFNSGGGFGYSHFTSFHFPSTTKNCKSFRGGVTLNKTNITELMAETKIGSRHGIVQIGAVGGNRPERQTK